MNTTELINALKIRGSFPASNDLFSTSDFLVLFNHQMLMDIYPLLKKLNEEYFLETKDYTVSAGSTYRIPTRAGSSIRDLNIVDASGNYTGIPRLFEEDRQSGKKGYYLKRNSIELSSDYTSDTLRVSYIATPSKLVETSSCGQVLSIDTVNNQVVVSSAPSTFGTSVLVDFVQNNNPYDLLGADYSISGVSGTTISFSSLPTGLAVGDWVCIANQSPVPQLPEVLHPVLVQSALVAALSSKKDKSFEQERDLLEQYKQNATNMLDPRVENDSVKLRSNKLFSYFAARRY